MLVCHTVTQAQRSLSGLQIHRLHLFVCVCVCVCAKQLTYEHTCITSYIWTHLYNKLHMDKSV